MTRVMGQGQGSRLPVFQQILRRIFSQVSFVTSLGVSSEAVRATMTIRLPRAGHRTTPGRTTTRISAAKKVRSHSASITPTASMTKTDSAEPACIRIPRITTRTTAVAESRAAVGATGPAVGGTVEGVTGSMPRE